MSEETTLREAPDEITELTDNIIRDVFPILDREQRLFLITEKFRKLPAPTLVEVLRVVAAGATRHDPKYQDFFRLISDIRNLAKKIGFGKMSEVYTLARRKDYAEVVRFMQMAPPAKKLGEDEELESDPILQDLTLGAKRQIAKAKNPDLINRLCHDQDPVVIKNLLNNPRVTIKEVIKIASKRPTSAAILNVIYRDHKWSNHYVVKMALVNNPYTPTELSLSLLPLLMEMDLVDVAENTILHPALRKAAIEMIKEKRKKTIRERKPDQTEPALKAMARDNEHEET